MQFWKLGNVTWKFPSFSWGILSHMTCLDNHGDLKRFDGLEFKTAGPKLKEYKQSENAICLVK